MRIIFLITALGMSTAVSTAVVEAAQESTKTETEKSAPIVGAEPFTPVGSLEAMLLLPLPPETIAQLPAVEHIARSGARVFDAGAAHGMRRIVARQGAGFMILQVAPDGAAVIAGLQTDLSTTSLLAVAGPEQVTELGTVHGVRGLFVRNGEQFQVFYATPDGERVIPGVMWDAAGKNITREQVAPLPGVTPSVVIGDDKARNDQTGSVSASGNKSALALAQQTTFGVSGSESAPRLYMFIDPLCGYSVKALQQMQPFVASGRVQGAIIPVSVLDYEDQGRSTSSALSLLSKPSDQLATAWSRGDLDGPVAADAERKLRGNMEAAEAIGLRGTPTLIWRKADGTEGRLDGLPEDWNAVIASMGGESHAAR